MLRCNLAAGVWLLAMLLGGCSLLERETRVQAVARLVHTGRGKLAQRLADEALVDFEEAAHIDERSLETRIWILRAWMDQGRNNDTLDAIDALVAEGHHGPEIDYLYGMAFARRAEQNLADGVTDVSIRMNFGDSAELLAKAVGADGERFHDAWLSLARAAWETRDLKQARRAIRRAIELKPDSAAVRRMEGHIAFSLFEGTRPSDAREPEQWGAEASAHWRDARLAFERAVNLCGHPIDDAWMRQLLSSSAVQLGNTLVWGQRDSAAAEAYAQALAWGPESVHVASVEEWLAADREDGHPDAFRDALARAIALFTELWGETPSLATLYWWLGYAEWTLAHGDAAERAFLAALERFPDYSNGWFYVGLVRYDRGDFDAATEALRSGWEADPTSLLEAAQHDPPRTVAKLETMIARWVEQERFEDAALLSEICAELMPKEVRHWNNTGLFLRDDADRQVERVAKAERERLREHYERALKAYARALRIDPEDPQLLNDAAVILQYGLERDFEAARAMYARAISGARLRLAQDALGDEDRTRYEAALEDATENTKVLDEMAAEDRQSADRD